MTASDVPEVVVTEAGEVPSLGSRPRPDLATTVLAGIPIESPNVLKGRTIVMSGGSRGIGLGILIAAARHGANSVLLAKTDQADPRLPGTVHTAVSEIEAQVLTLSPPINLAPHWLGRFPSYTLSKYGMTLLTLGYAEEFANDKMRANCLWPETKIATAAGVRLLGGAEATARSRTVEIMADAAVALLTDPTKPNGLAAIDVDVLAAAGVTDLSPYGGTDNPDLDFFVDPT